MKDSIKKPKYKVVLEVLTQKWESQGQTLLKALEGLKLTWDQIKGKGILTVYKGSKKHEHLMTMPLIRKILANKIVKAYWAKNLEYLLDGDNKTNIPERLNK